MKQFSPSYPLIFLIHFDTNGDTIGVIWPQKDAHQSRASGSEPRFLHGLKQSGLKTKHLKGCSRLSVYTLGCQDPNQSWNQLPHRVTGWLWYSMERSQNIWGGNDHFGKDQNASLQMNDFSAWSRQGGTQGCPATCRLTPSDNGPDLFFNLNLCLDINHIIWLFLILKEGKATKMELQNSVKNVEQSDESSRPMPIPRSLMRGRVV